MSSHNVRNASIDRRTLLKVSGTLLGGIASGGIVRAAEATDRFLLDTGKRVTERDVQRTEDAGVEILYRLGPIGVLVVRGVESTVEELGYDFAPDLWLDLNLPIDSLKSEGNSRYKTESATDEPLYPLQWDKQRQDVPDAHEVTRGEGVRVAVVDSGIDHLHPDLQHAVNTDLSKNFTDDEFGAPGPFGGHHGTLVGGVIAANDQNERGVVGTAPAAELVDLRVLSLGGLSPFSRTNAAILHAVQIDADVVNLSLGAYPISRPGLGPFYGKILNRLSTFANKEGSLLVTSAGNNAADLQHDKNVIAPRAESANVVTVSATGPVGFGWPIDDQNGNGELDGLAELEDPIEFENPPHTPAFYTNYGANVIDVSAPGGNMDSDAFEAIIDDDPDTNPPPGWYLDSVFNTLSFPISLDPPQFFRGYGGDLGTSFATPQVSGAAALVKSVNPEFNPNQIRQRLKNTAEDVGKKGHDEYHGAGFLNPASAVSR